VLFGALLLQGMRPGPELFTGRGAEITYTFIFSLFLANLMMFVLGFFGSRVYARALNLPRHLLMPVVLVLSVVGSFASRNNFFDLALMLGLGVLAYFGKKVNIPPAPVALGVILGPIIEQGLVESMMLSEATGSLAGLFFTRPISIILILLTVLSAGWPLAQHWMSRRRSAASGGTFAPSTRQRKVAGALSHRSANFILAAFGGAICLVVILALRGIDLQTAVLPWVCAAMLGAISLGLMVKALRLPLSPDRPPEHQPWNARAVVGAIGVAAGYLVCMQILGFYTSTFAAVGTQAFLMKGGDTGRWWIIPLTSAAVCASFYLVFERIFNVPFPQGLLF
jgi:putative tricarboxylic transport membrane protein